MTFYPKVLFATNLKEHSLSLGHRAKDLAEKLNAQLILVHVVALPLLYRWQPKLTQVRQQKLTQAVAPNFEQLRVALDLAPTDAYLIVGEPQSQILHMTAQLNIDLLILGKNDGSAKALGSTLQHVLQKAQCDVLSFSHKNAQNNQATPAVTPPLSGSVHGTPQAVKRGPHLTLRANKVPFNAQERSEEEQK
jgi:nucleotide-binding universal stress UspA family protein